MKHAAAGLLLFAAALGPALAQEQPPARPEDPLLMQRRLAMVLRQSTKHYEAEQYQAALDRLNVLQGPAAQDLSVLNLRGAILTKMGRYQEALDLFNAILATDRNYFPAAFNLGEVQFLSGDIAGALETFQSMRRRDPRNELVRFKIIVCLLKLNRDDQAKGIADGLVPAGGTPAWYYAQAMIARKAGDEKTAQKHLNAARSIYLDTGCKLFDESIAPVKF
jgi:tetratricopeptide (TPR) repeat protein